MNNSAFAGADGHMEIRHAVTISTKHSRIDLTGYQDKKKSKDFSNSQDHGCITSEENNEI